MPEPPELPSGVVSPSPPTPESDKMLCDRCGAEMYRMHAVWRGPRCGFKTDCRGW